MYEVNQMTIEQIAATTGFEPLAIKATLAAYSPTYRKDISVQQSFQQTKSPVPSGAPPTIAEDISDTDFELIRQAALGIALDTSNDYVPTKARMLKFLWNEKKGRNNVNGLRGASVNILQFNDHIVQAARAVKDALGQTTVDVEAEKVA
jgi:hypothetical protein